MVRDSRDVARFSISHHCAEMKDSETGLLLMSSVTMGGPIVSVGWMWDRTYVWARFFSALFQAQLSAGHIVVPNETVLNKSSFLFWL